MTAHSESPSGASSIRAGRYIDPATHEVDGNLIFTDAGLSPYYGLHSVTEESDYGDPVEGEFSRSGEMWEISLRPRSSNLAPRDDPSFEFSKVKEFNLSIRPKGTESNEQRKAEFHIAPRWPDLKSTGDSPNPNTPDLLGVNVNFKGSNLSLGHYPALLREAMSAVSINADCFTDPHEYSNVTRYALYVRVADEKSGTVIGRDGTFERIWEQVGTGDGKFRELREDDRGTQGYFHQLKMDSGGSETLFPDHVLGKQLKHYHPKHVRSEETRTDSDDPLAHPKVEVCFLKRLSDRNAAPWVTGGGSIRWSEREKLIREVDETLINVLSWSGLMVRADTRTYVEDTHFTGQETERELSVIEDPLPEIKREQDAALVNALNGVGTGNPNLNESDTEVLRVMADGGQPQDVDTLAGAIGISTRSIYRIVERMDGVLSVDNGTVSFASEYLQSKARYGYQATTDALEKATKDQEDTSAWGKFIDAYGPAVGERFPDAPSERIELDFGEIPPDADMDEILQEGFRAWVRSGREPADYQIGQAVWTVNGKKRSTPEYDRSGHPMPVRLTRECFPDRSGGSDLEGRSPLREIFD